MKERTVDVSIVKSSNAGYIYFRVRPELAEEIMNSETVSITYFEPEQKKEFTPSDIERAYSILFSRTMSWNEKDLVKELFDEDK